MIWRPPRPRPKKALEFAYALLAGMRARCGALRNDHRSQRRLGELGGDKLIRPIAIRGAVGTVGS